MQIDSLIISIRYFDIQWVQFAVTIFLFVFQFATLLFVEHPFDCFYLIGPELSFETTQLLYIIINELNT